MESATTSTEHMPLNRIRSLSQTNEANILIDEAFLNLDDELRKLTNDTRKMEELIVGGRHGTIQPYVLSSKELLILLRTLKHIDNFPGGNNTLHHFKRYK